MKRIWSLVSLYVTGFLIVAGALLQTGCEEAGGLQGLQVDPASVTLSTNGQTVVFTVTGGVDTNSLMALPLSWTVKNEDLGRITFSGGFTAVYQRLAPNGVNTVLVKDQYGNEGFAAVRQTAVEYSLELTASPSATIKEGEAATISITTASAQAPFAWRKVSGPGSLAANSGSSSAAYSSSTAGTAAIEVIDANGASGVISIVIQSAADDGDGGGGGGAGGS